MSNPKRPSILTTKEDSNTKRVRLDALSGDYIRNTDSKGGFLLEEPNALTSGSVNKEDKKTISFWEPGMPIILSVLHARIQTTQCMNK